MFDKPVAYIMTEEREMEGTRTWRKKKHRIVIINNRNKNKLAFRLQRLGVLYWAFSILILTSIFRPIHSRNPLLVWSLTLEVKDLMNNFLELISCFFFSSHSGDGSFLARGSVLINLLACLSGFNRGMFRIWTVVSQVWSSFY